MIVLICISFAHKIVGNQSGPNGVLSADAPVLSSNIDPNSGKQIPINPGFAKSIPGGEL